MAPFFVALAAPEAAVRNTRGNMLDRTAFNLTFALASSTSDRTFRP